MTAIRGWRIVDVHFAVCGKLANIPSPTVKAELISTARFPPTSFLLPESGGAGGQESSSSRVEVVNCSRSYRSTMFSTAWGTYWFATQREAGQKSSSRPTDLRVVKKGQWLDMHVLVLLMVIYIVTKSGDQCVHALLYLLVCLQMIYGCRHRRSFQESRQRCKKLWWELLSAIGEVDVWCSIGVNLFSLDSSGYIWCANLCGRNCPSPLWETVCCCEVPRLVEGNRRKRKEGKRKRKERKRERRL